MPNRAVRRGGEGAPVLRVQCVDQRIGVTGFDVGRVLGGMRSRGAFPGADAEQAEYVVVGARAIEGAVQPQCFGNGLRMCFLRRGCDEQGVRSTMPGQAKEAHERVRFAKDRESNESIDESFISKIPVQ